VGGFEDVLLHPDNAPCALPVSRTSEETKLQLLVLQEALKVADQTDPPLLEHVHDMHTCTASR
jgi:hypothetical protein